MAEIGRGLDEFTVPVSRNLGRPLAAGLWLAAPVALELLAEPGRVPAFRDSLTGRGLTCHTLNAFPYGDFHSRRVKENVYLPDWADQRRLDYTMQCARILASLLPLGCDGSISTVPIAFKRFPHGSDHLRRAIDNLLELAARLDRLRHECGRTVRLAIEPEPLCLLETTPETVGFFAALRERAAETRRLDLALEHLGVCYDVCHQAVEFEDVPGSIAALEAAGIRINKVHITCAIELPSPADNREGRAALARYVEERYLHQTFALTHTGEVLREVDLTEELALRPPPDFLEASAWRVHFHVPVNAESLGPLKTTRDELRQALAAVSRLSYAPHLEVETYTWNVLPGERDSHDLVAGLTSELASTQALLDGLSGAM